MRLNPPQIYSVDDRDILNAPDAQPFLISGSGTLGWDQAAANLIESGDEVLVLTTGYFGDSFADCLNTYGAKVTQVTASPVGAAFAPEEVEKVLQGKKYKAVTFTHVDTSTGVLNDAKMIAELVKRASPETLVNLILFRRESPVRLSFPGIRGLCLLSCERRNSPERVGDRCCHKRFPERCWRSTWLEYS